MLTGKIDRKPSVYSKILNSPKMQEERFENSPTFLEPMPEEQTFKKDSSKMQEERSEKSIFQEPIPLPDLSEKQVNSKTSQEEQAGNSSGFSEPIPFPDVPKKLQENCDVKRKIKSDTHNRKSHLWKNLSHIFSKSSKKSSVIGDASAFGMIKPKSSSKRFGPFFKHQKATANCDQSFTSAGSQLHFHNSMPSAVHDENRNLWMAVTLPTGVESTDLSFAVEVEAIKEDQEGSSHTKLNGDDVVILKCCEVSATEVVFSGNITIPPNTNLDSIPMYIMDSREKEIKQPCSEMTLTTIIKPSAKISNQDKRDSVIVGDVKVTLKLKKDSKGTNKSKLESFKNNQQQKSDKNDGSSLNIEAVNNDPYKVLLFSNRSQPETLSVAPQKSNELELNDFCGLELKESFDDELMDSTSKTKRLTDEELLPQSPCSTVRLNRNLQTVSTQYSVTNFTASKSTEVHSSLLLPTLGVPRELINQVPSNTTMQSLIYSEFPSIRSSLEAIWAQNQTASSITDYGRGLISSFYDFPVNNVTVPSTSQDKYKNQTGLSEAKNIQTEDFPFIFPLTDVNNDTDGVQETTNTHPALDVLTGAKSKLESYLGNEVLDPQLSFMPDEDLTTTGLDENFWKLNRRDRLDDDKEFYESLIREDIRQPFGEDPSCDKGEDEDQRSGSNGNNHQTGSNCDTTTFYTYPSFSKDSVLTLANHKVDEDYFENMKTVLNTEINNMETIYKGIFDGVNKVLDLIEMTRDEVLKDNTPDAVEEINKDLRRTFKELKTCISQMNQTLSENNMTPFLYDTKQQETTTNLLTIQPEGTETKENDKQTASNERDQTYFSLENEIERTITELLKESQGIKETAILNGAKEEAEPPFTTKFLHPSDNLDPYIVCLNIVDEIVNASAEVVSRRSPVGDTSTFEELKNMLYALVESIKKDNCNLPIGDSMNKNHDDSQITKPKVYFCNIKSLAPKIPKTSYSFGEGPAKDKRLLRPKSKSPSRRRDGLSALGVENLRLVEELRNLEGLLNEKDQNEDNREFESNHNSKPNNPPPIQKVNPNAPEDIPKDGIRKSAKHFQLSTTAHRQTYHVPIPDKICKEVKTTDEEHVIADTNLEATGSVSGGEIDHCIQKKIPASWLKYKKCANQYENDSSDDDESASTSRRGTQLKRAKRDDLVVLKSSTDLESSIDSCTITDVVGKADYHTDSSIRLRPTPATADIQNTLNEHTEEPGRNLSTIENSQPLELTHHQAQASGLNLNRQQIPDSDYEMLQLKLSKTKHRYESVQQLNSLDEIEQIERNATENDILEKSLKMLCQSDYYASGYESDSSSHLEAESKSVIITTSAACGSSLINIVNADEHPSVISYTTELPKSS